MAQSGGSQSAELGFGLPQPWTNTEGRAFEFVDGDNSRDQDAFLKLVDVDAEAGAQGSGPTSGQVDAGRA